MPIWCLLSTHQDADFCHYNPFVTQSQVGNVDILLKKFNVVVKINTKL